MTSLPDETKQSSIDALKVAAASGVPSASAVQNAARYLTEPAYEEFAPRVVELVEAGEFQKIDDLFWEVIPFGTGGRRGKMGEFGTATINPRTVAESAHGLAVHAVKSNGQPGKAVVAHDTRNRSREFAELTATTLAAHGFEVFLFDSHRTTPELSFAVRHLGCDVGVMITASHNPPADNGFKAYWSTGGQVLAPHDKGIIDEVLAAEGIPALDLDTATADGKVKIVGKEIDEAYLLEVGKQTLSPARDVVGIYSPLHGAGETNCYETIVRLGFSGVEIFEPHREPDGNFPGVPKQYPNPENTAVYDPLTDRAKEIDADLLLASDPDADRVGVCVKNAAGEYVPLTGNQVGSLALDHVLRHRAKAGTLSSEHFAVTTLVTTPLFSAVANAHEIRCIDDLLVGFKYIAEAMDANGPDRFVFGSEESLGYLAGEYARDKDAAVGVLYTLEHAAELKAQGKTLFDRLDELYCEHGYHLEGQKNVFFEGSEGKAKIDKLMTLLRENPPLDLGRTVVSRVRDYETHEVRKIPGGRQIEELPSPSGDLLVFESQISPIEFKIAVRPSGTEPKIKFYFFGHAEVAGPDRLDKMKELVHDRYDDLLQALDRWIESQFEEDDS